MQDRTITIILAGGVGSRLHPLTADRAKPAVPFGGKYRIIDFTLSNCHHSGLRRILVLTQYKSHSLQKHLRDGWSIFNPTIGEYITPVPPQMRTGESWYAGTADAVYQNLYLLERSGADQVLILSGDHVYRMDYAAMLRFHCDHLADATVACMRVPRDQAKSFGVMAVDRDRRIVEFQEKPADPKPLPQDPDHSLASMGIYTFSRDLLCDLLEADHRNGSSSHDFGKDILPQLINERAVYGYEFGTPLGRVTADGYWRDVGTIDAYFDANMDLLQPQPPLDLHQSSWCIRTTEVQAPPAWTIRGSGGRHANVEDSLLGPGCMVRGATVTHSILSPNVVVEEGAEVADSILCDDVRVGSGARLLRCIVDKHVVIPAGETIGYDLELDRQRFTISDQGIVVVPKNYRFAAQQRTAGRTAGRTISQLS